MSQYDTQTAAYYGWSVPSTHTWFHGATQIFSPLAPIQFISRFIVFCNFWWRLWPTHTKTHMYHAANTITTTTIVRPFVQHYPTTTVDQHPFFQDNRVAWYRKNKPFQILLKQRWWGGSGISWTTCKSFGPRSRQIKMPEPHCRGFHRAEAFPDGQDMQLKQWMKKQNMVYKDNKNNIMRLANAQSQQ